MDNATMMYNIIQMMKSTHEAMQRNTAESLWTSGRAELLDDILMQFDIIFEEDVHPEPASTAGSSWGIQK